MTTRHAHGAPRRTTYHHGDLHRALVEAARHLLKEEGPDGLTVRAAARRAGVTHSATYRHFPSKDALLAAVAEEGFRSLERALRRSLAAAEGPVERLSSMAVAYVDFARRQPASFRLMLGPGAPNKATYPPLEAAARATFAILVEAVSACQAEGRMRSTPPLRLATVAWATMHGLATLVADTRVMEMKFADLDPKTLTRMVMEDLHRGLRSP
jgi:AcrR family transcriptional regulator